MTNKFNPDIHHRQSIRLKGYDYSVDGAYFVTICAWQRQCLFGEIMAGEMRLYELGRIVEKCWQEIPAHFPQVGLDEFIIMPNHLHGIIFSTKSVELVGAKNLLPIQATPQYPLRAKDFSPLRLTPPGTLRAKDFSLLQHGTSKTIGSVIRGVKIGVTKWVRQNTANYQVWQRNFYERVIRNEDELACAREYIVNNPIKWDMDQENPARYLPV